MNINKAKMDCLWIAERNKKLGHRLSSICVYSKNNVTFSFSAEDKKISLEKVRMQLPETDASIQLKDKQGRKNNNSKQT